MEIATSPADISFQCLEQCEPQWTLTEIATVCGGSICATSVFQQESTHTAGGRRKALLCYSILTVGGL